LNDHLNNAARTICSVKSAQLLHGVFIMIAGQPNGRSHRQLDRSALRAMKPKGLRPSRATSRLPMLPRLHLCSTPLRFGLSAHATRLGDSPQLALSTPTARRGRQGCSYSTAPHSRAQPGLNEIAIRAVDSQIRTRRWAQSELRIKTKKAILLPTVSKKRIQGRPSIILPHKHRTRMEDWQTRWLLWRCSLQS
jgi:hypothetical protein